MHRVDLVVEVGTDDRAVRGRQLQADQQGLEAADDEEEQRGRSVEDADLLVVDGGDPVTPATTALGAGVCAQWLRRSAVRGQFCNGFTHHSTSVAAIISIDGLAPRVWR